MLRNFFKVAFRNLSRHKGFSLINISGLTLGITACLLIGLFVYDELQYDKFIPKSDQIYRLYTERTRAAGFEKMAMTPPMYTTTLNHDFPEVEKTLKVFQIQFKMLFEAGDKKSYEEGGVLAEPNFFDFFPLSFKYGSSAGSLDEVNSIVISEGLATRMFGSENPVGKTILLDKQQSIVKGVFLPNPKFHLPINFVSTLASAQFPQTRMESWQWSQFNNYVMLKPGANVSSIQSALQKIVKEKASSGTNEGESMVPFFQALKDIHLQSASFKFDMALRGDITYVRALTIIAIFILLIACFNFINLATAKSLQRAKEVGVRKTIGAGRSQLIIQFIGETILLALISIIIAAGLTFILLPSLNHFTDKQISGSIFSNPVVIGILILLAAVVGIIAGFYPAIVLSRFQPVKVLKGTITADNPGKIPWLRHGLVVVQFSVSVLLIISAIVVIRQVNYLHNKDLGFNKDELMFFPMRGDNMFNNYESFKNELLQSPGISSVSIGYGFPGDMVAGDEIIVPHDNEMKSLSATQLMVDYDYIKTLGLQVIAGRDFSKDMKTDRDKAFIINETAVRVLGFGTPEKALGQTLLWKDWNSKNPDSLKNGQIIGVVKDFHYKSLYDKVETAILQIYPPAYWKVAVKVKTAGVANSINHVKEVWKKFSPEYPIEYRFLDENFENMYKSEDKLESLLGIFTAIAIFVGCLGLFGLAAYSAELRRKEVGIRKVLGASARGLMMLLSKDFLRLVLIALVIASPIAWILMNKWLQDFSYRINISWWMFALAGTLAVLIALVTVSFQAVKAALSNPVTSLRSE